MSGLTKAATFSDARVGHLCAAAHGVERTRSPAWRCRVAQSIAPSFRREKLAVLRRSQRLGVEQGGVDDARDLAVRIERHG